MKQAVVNLSSGSVWEAPRRGLRSLRQVTPRWKGQKLTNIEPLSSGQRLVDKAAIRFLCRQCRAAEAASRPASQPEEALERVLHLMEPASLAPEASNHFHYLLPPPDSSSMLWLNLRSFMKAGNWKWGHNSCKAAFGTAAAISQWSSDRRRPRAKLLWDKKQMVTISSIWMLNRVKRVAITAV